MDIESVDFRTSGPCPKGFSQSSPGLPSRVCVVFRTEAHRAVVYMDVSFRTLASVVSRTGIFVGMLSELGLSWLLSFGLGCRRRTMVFRTNFCGHAV